MKPIEPITNGSASSVDPLAVLLVNEFRASGARAWLGFPSEAEISQSIAEKEESDFQRMKARAEAADRRYKRLMARAREASSRNHNV
jgi:hypothetical protein